MLSLKRTAFLLGSAALATALSFGAPAKALNCNLDGTGDTTLPSTGDVSRLLTIIVESQTGCAGNLCDFNNDGSGPNVGDLAALLNIASTQVNTGNICSTTTGGAVVGEVDTSGTVSARGASSRMAKNLGDLSQLSAKMYTVDAQGNLTALSNVSPVSLSVTAGSTTQATYTFQGVPEDTVNAVVKIENLGDPTAATLQAILPSVSTTDSTEMRIDLKTDKETEVLKEVVKAGIQLAFIDPSIIKQNISTEMITSGTFNPQNFAAGIKEASQNLFDQVKSDLGVTDNTQVLQQLKNIRRHQFDSVRLKERIAQLSETDPRRSELKQKLESSLTRFETEVKEKLPPKQGEDKNGLEKFQQFQQASDAKLQANIQDPTLKAEIEKRGKAQDFLRQFQAKMGFLFPPATVTGGPVSPLAIIAKVNRLGFGDNEDATLSASLKFKAIFDNLSLKAEDPLADPDSLVSDAIGEVKLLRNQFLTADNLVPLADITGVETALKGLEDQIQTKFQSGETPAQVDTYVREQLPNVLSALLTALDTRLANLDQAARTPVKEAVRQLIVALSTGRIPPHLVRDPNAPLPAPTNIAPPADTDNDGFPDFIEQKEGTDPNNADSKPQVIVVMRPNDGVDNDNDGSTDEEKGGFNGIDDDADGRTDEDVSDVIPTTNFRGVLLKDGQPLTGVYLTLAFNPPGPDMRVAYSTSIATNEAGEFMFTNINAGRYFLAGHIEVDNQPGISASDKLGFVGGSQGPQPIEIPPPNPDRPEVFMTIPNFVIASQGAIGRVQLTLLGVDPDGQGPNLAPAISGSIQACRAQQQGELGASMLSQGFDAFQASTTCNPPMPVQSDGHISPSGGLALEPGIWLIKAFFQPPGDDCYRKAVANVMSQQPADPPFQLSMSQPFCKSAILNPPQGTSLFRLFGTDQRLASNDPNISQDVSMRAGIFSEPPRHGGWVIKIASQSVTVTGTFEIGGIPQGLPFFLGYWRELNNMPGPQPGEPLAVFSEEFQGQKRPRIISLSQDTDIATLSPSFLVAISVPREVTGSMVISPSGALSDSAKADAEVAACLTASSMLLGPPPPPPTGRTASVEPDPNQPPPQPCFFTRTDPIGNYKFYLNPGLYEVRGRSNNGTVTLMHRLEVLPAPHPNHFSPGPLPAGVNSPPPLGLTVTGSQPFPPAN